MKNQNILRVMVSVAALLMPAASYAAEPVASDPLAELNAVVDGSHNGFTSNSEECNNTNTGDFCVNNSSSSLSCKFSKDNKKWIKVCTCIGVFDAYGIYFCDVFPMRPGVSW